MVLLTQALTLQYRVVSLDKQDLTEGFSVVTNPADTLASPDGWHVAGSNSYNATRGNNVVAYKTNTSGTIHCHCSIRNWLTWLRLGTGAPTSSNLDFLYVQDPSLAPASGPNLDAARVNAFYIGNSIHVSLG